MHKYTILPNYNYIYGADIIHNGYDFSVISESDEITLLLFEHGREEPVYSIPVDKRYKRGDVFTFRITDIPLLEYEYLYMADGEVFADPYAKLLSGLPEFGIKDTTGLQHIKGLLKKLQYNWKNDIKPCINTEDIILYKLHTRGFTMSKSSKVKHPGTFKGISEKINYLKKTGINAVLLMPSYEFEEYAFNFNYWGYGKGFYFLPKAAYSSCYGSCVDYTVEFKDMVKKFHKNGMEVYMEFNFTDEVDACMADDCIRYWKESYHIDGARVICNDRIRQVIADDPYLVDIKLFYEYWDNNFRNHNLLEYNEGFENVARKLLKGDEGQLKYFSECFKKNPVHGYTVNFVCDNNGFTLYDLVSYDRKHNEENGENNRDGKDYNNSWNCGEEGDTKNRKILAQRLRNRKNAMCFVLLSQGIPMIYAGDEFGNSQNGNNNAYCQDNETGWLDWSALRKNRKFYNFICTLINFRHNHKVLHIEKELVQSDYKYFGLPDISYHGSKAWYPEMEHYNRHLGILLCGRYAEENEDIYIGMNLHWEKHILALPKIPGKTWEIIINTNDNEDVFVGDDSTIEVPPRTVVVIISKKWLKYVIYYYKIVKDNLRR